MPLARTSDGRLGVRSEGGTAAGVVVHYNQTYTIDARGADAAQIAGLRADLAQMKREIVPQVVDAVRRGGSARRFMRG